MVFRYQIALWVSGEYEIVGRAPSLFVEHCWCIQLIVSLRSVRGNGGPVKAGDEVYLHVFRRSAEASGTNA